KWTSGTFDQKVFVENNGQFSGSEKNFTGEVKFGAEYEGMEVFFTPGGLTWLHSEFQNEKRSEEPEKNPHREDAPKIIPHYVYMTWEGANQNAKIIAENSVSYYFTYPDENDPTGKS